MSHKPVRWGIWLRAQLRWLTYPLAILAAVWAINKISVTSAGFWSPSQYGLIMLAFAVSALAVATLHLAEPRRAPQKDKAVRRSQGDAGTFWLIAFALSASVVLAFAVLQRAPTYMACWSVLASSPSPAPADTKAKCAKLAFQP